MSFDDIETARIKRAMEGFLAARRPRPDIREQLDLGYSINGQSVEIFELRPAWREPNTIVKHPAAKATFVRTQKVWKIFCMRGDLAWCRYEPKPTTPNIDEFADIVARDEYCHFFG